MGYAIAVAITVITTATALGTIALRASGRPWRHALVAIACALPLHALSLFLLRLPLHRVLTGQLEPDTLYGVSSLYAPLLEEPPKWLVLVGLAMAGWLTRERAVGLALATGLGFGLGEIGTLAAGIFINAPEQTHLPFYVYTGFFIERLLVCFLHGGFIIAFALALAGRRWRWIVPAALLGLILHWLVNAPIALGGIGAFGLSRTEWLAFALPWLVLMTVGLAVFAMVAQRLSSGRALMSDATCGRCRTPFQRTLFGLNLGPWQLRRCPHCLAWQLV